MTTRQQALGRKRGSRNPRRIVAGGRLRRAVTEHLESRRLLSLLGVNPGFPKISYGSSPPQDPVPELSYNANVLSFTFVANGTPMSVQFPSSPGVSSNVSIFAARDIRFSMRIDNSGTLLGGVNGDDLTIIGTVTDPGADGKIGTGDDTAYSGTLLTGEVLAYGSQNGTGTVGSPDLFDFRFQPTGGAFANKFYTNSFGQITQDIGITLTDLSISGVPQFDGSFGTTFGGQVNGLVGPIPTQSQPQNPIKLVKLTNGTDNDGPTGPHVPVGSTVTWTYNVTNTVPLPLGQPMHNIVVNDDNGTSGNLADDFTATPSLNGGGFNVGDTNSNNLLDPGETWVFTASKPALAGQYENNALVTALSPTNATATDTNPDHYFGDAPDIHIIKKVNGDDANTAPGVHVPTGSTLTFTYDVTTTGNVPISNVQVNDNVLGSITGFYTGGDTSNDGLLDPGETWHYSTTAMALVGQHLNTGTVTGSDSFTGAPVTDNNPANYFGDSPAVKIVKYVNNDDADSPTGPHVSVPGSVTFKYLVANPGNVPLSNVVVTDDKLGTISGPPSGDTHNLGQLDTDETWTYTVTVAAAAGQQTNVGTVNADDANNTAQHVTDNNPANYYGDTPAINIVKKVNGFDADSPTGPFVGVPGTVVFTYFVTNPGNVPIKDVVVTDDKLGIISGPLSGDTHNPGQLDTDETWLYSVAAPAAAGQQTNIGTVNGKDVFTDAPATDDNPANYFGDTPAINIVKFVNGDDADSPTGPHVPVPSTVTFTYVVTNPGNAPLKNVVVTDDKLGAISGPAIGDTHNLGQLDTDETWTYSVTAPAQAGQQTNVGTVNADDANNTAQHVTDNNPANYYGDTPGIKIIKYVNGNDANAVPGIYVATGSAVTFTYVVTNTGNVPLTNVAVNDNILGTITSFTGDTNNNGLLDLTETWTYTKNATAQAGQQTNVGTVTGNDVNNPPGTAVTDNNPANYFGYNIVTIGDFVWHDLNANGIQNGGGEIGIAGVALTLTGTDVRGTAVSDDATTDGTGKYLFTEIQGTYTVTVDASNFAGGGALVGYTPSPTLQGGDNTKDSNPNPSGTTPANLTGGSDLTLDFGYYKTAGLGDFLWLDTNRNGQQDASEPGIDGVTVKLLDLTGTTVLATTTTGDNPNLAGTQHGYYQFINLTPGTYVVQFMTGGGYDKFTSANVGSDTTDSDANQTTGKTGTYTLASGEFNSTVDAGLLPIDLQLTKFVNNATPNIGSNVIFTLTLTNNNAAPGVSTATGVSVKDVLPAGLTYVSDDAGGAYNSGSGVWTAGTLPPGASATLQITATVASGGTKTNYAQVTTADQIDTDSTPNNNPSGPPSEDDEAQVSINTPPGIHIEKDASTTVANPNVPVTYTYTVTNTGSVPLSNVVVKDDNGTPNYAGDDFNPTPVLGADLVHNVGDTNNDGLLDPTEIWKYTATVIPPVQMTVTVNSTTYDSGTLSYQMLPNGDVRVFYRQSLNFNDNTYGTGSTWTNGHTHAFSDLTGSDKAGFLVKYSDGTTLVQFYQDYLSSSGTANAAAGYSGYQSLGYASGDGSLVAGNGAVLKDFDSTLEVDLNRVGYTGYTTNSPLSSDPKYPGWDPIDGYMFTISAAAFSSKSFGGVTIFDQHNSPAKTGSSNSYIPVIKTSASTNTATASGSNNGNTVTDDDTATVTIVTGPLASLGDRLWSDTNGNGVQDAGETGIPGQTVTLIGGGTDGLISTAGDNTTTTTTTGADGIYGFTNLIPGTQYQVQFTKPAGTVFTGKDLGGDDTKDSDVDSTGLSPIVTLASGQNNTTIDAGVTTPPTAIGDFVWIDSNSNGIQDAGEVGLNGVTVVLTGAGADNTFGTGDDTTASAMTANNGSSQPGYYLFTGLTAGQYMLKFILPTGYSFTAQDVGGDNTKDSDANPSTGKTTTITLASGQIDLTWDAGLIGVAPKVGIDKQADKTLITPGSKVTYTYYVSNPGTQPLHNVTVVDDNGTPDYAADDFSPAPVLTGGFNVGDTNQNNLLDPDELWQYKATIIPPITMCDTINGVDTVVGTLIPQILPSGDISVTYVESTALNDNSYGSNIVNWPRSHAFSDLLGSDKAEFRFTNAAGATVFDFYLDYISAATGVASGYKSLGLSGGDGSLVSGTASWLLSYDTSISKDFNGSGLGVTNGVASDTNHTNLALNSPKTISSSSYQVQDPFFRPWEFRIIYTVTVSKSAFGTSGFGGVSIPLVHNSPPKVGLNASAPKYCNGTVTNTATLTATTPTGGTITATDDASVQVLTTITPSSLSGYVYNDANSSGSKDSGEAGIGGTRVDLIGTDYNGATVSRTVMTASTGFYRFSNLLPGTYTITETQPALWTDGIDTQGTPGTGVSGNDYFASITLGSGVNGQNNNFGETNGPISISKSLVGNKTRAAFTPVTYNYTVTAKQATSNVVVIDDNGTPNDPSDDFYPTRTGGDDGDNILEPGETWTYSATVIPQVQMCMTINGVMTTVGTLQLVDVGSSYRVIYRQSRDVVDNTYGVNAVGYKSGHKFSDLTGSDKAEFRITNSSGQTVLDFFIDYLSSSTGAPSGYQTLGFSGGDGSIVTGSPGTYVSDIHTSISDDLNKSPFTTGYTTNSPAPEANFPTWDYVDGYSFLLSKTAFTTGSKIAVPLVHNSPSKLGFNAFYPTPCDTFVTNTATVTGTFSSTAISSSSSATVEITSNTQQSPSTSSVTAGPLQFSGKQATVTLTNNGSSAVSLSELIARWPTTNGKLNSVKFGSSTIYDTAINGGYADLTTFKGTSAGRTLNAGASISITFNFEKNASTNASLYDFQFNFSNGDQVFI